MCPCAVPETTPAFICERLRAYGAEVVVHGSQWSEANEYAMRQADQRNGVLVHPFEGADTWEGHGSLVRELAEQLPAPPAAVVGAVGGGGLVLGVLHGLQQVGWTTSVPVIAVETLGADSFARAMAAGELVTLPAITSVAKSLGASQVSPVRSVPRPSAPVLSPRNHSHTHTHTHNPSKRQNHTHVSSADA